MTVSRAAWTPGTGVGQVLNPSGTTNIDSAVSHGYIEIGFVADTGTAPKVAVALDYNGVDWYQEGSARYFEVPRADLRVASSNPTSTVFVAHVPMHSGMMLNPILINTQDFHVYVGAVGSMTVTNTSVTGHDDHEVYSIQTSLPGYSIVPPHESWIDGIRTTDSLQFVVTRDNEVGNEVVTLKYSGPASILDSLDLPASVTIANGEHAVVVTGSFNAYANTAWGGGATSFTVKASTALFPGGIASTFKVAETLDLPNDVLGVNGPASPEFDPEPTKGFYDKCNNTTTIPGVPADFDRRGCGKCVKTTIAAPCVRNRDTNGEHRHGYDRYSCSGFGNCAVVARLMPNAGFIVTVWVQPCTPQHGGLLGGIFGALFPATMDPHLAPMGHQCCFSLAASPAPGNALVPDCDPI